MVRELNVMEIRLLSILKKVQIRDTFIQNYHLAIVISMVLVQLKI